MPRLIAALVAVASLFVMGCGDSGSDGTTTVPETTEDAPAESTSSTTTTEAEAAAAAAAVALVGQWTADGADTLAANLSNLGGVPSAITCAGPITLTFNADGTYSAAGEVTCTVGGASLTASLMTTGAWSAEGDGTISITDSVSEGSFDLPGFEMPPIDLVSDGDFEYSIAGSTLTITFTDPSVGTVTQTWTRV